MRRISEVSHDGGVRGLRPWVGVGRAAGTGRGLVVAAIVVAGGSAGGSSWSLPGAPLSGVARALTMQHCVTSYGSYYSITNVGNGMELDAKNCGTANGTVAHPWQELDNTCQQWNIAP